MGEAVHRYEEPFDVGSIPTDILLKAARERMATMREKYGPWGCRLKLKKCKGCKREFGVRQMRTHDCIVPYSQRI